jgi:DNA topoisomerase IB
LRKALTLTSADSEDFEALLALRIEAMRESLERIGRFDLARVRERFQSGYSVEHTRHIKVEGKRVGFL